MHLAVTTCKEMDVYIHVLLCLKLDRTCGQVHFGQLYPRRKIP